MSLNYYSDSLSDKGGLLPSRHTYESFEGVFDSSLDSLISIDELREYIRLMDDESDDELLQRLRHDAALFVEDITGKPCTPRRVTNYYETWVNRFNLIRDWESIEDVSVLYIDRENQGELEFNTIIEDGTGSDFAVMVVDSVELSEDIMYPVNIAFDYTPSQGYQAAAREAVKFLVNQRYYTTGDMIMNNVDMNSLAFKALNAYRMRLA